MLSATYQIAKVIDAKGQVCPMPVLTLAKAMRDITSGQILTISATDPGAKKDIPAWAAKTGNTLLQMIEDQRVFTFYIQKK